jgi:hypothetical protein
MQTVPETKWLHNDEQLLFHRVQLFDAIVEEYPDKYKSLLAIKPFYDALGNYRAIGHCLALESFDSIKEHIINDVTKEVLCSFQAKFLDAFKWLKLPTSNHWTWFVAEVIAYQGTDKHRAMVFAAMPPVDRILPPSSFIRTYNPQRESRDGYLAEMNQRILTYTRMVELHYYEQNVDPLEEKREPEHYRWAAWRLVEGLSLNDVADRICERGQRESISHVSVSKALKSIARLTDTAL